MGYLIVGVLLVVAIALVVALVLTRRPPRPRGAAAPPGALAPARRRDDALGAKVRALFGRGAPTDDEWNGLRDLLVKADVGPGVASRLVADVRGHLQNGRDPAELLHGEILGMLGAGEGLELPPGRLSVIMVVGVNGAGKTTTIGKLAARLARAGKSVIVANSDTFRAAASEQLEAWAKRANVHLLAQERGGDPGAVAFDAVQSAKAKGVDVLIVDTAGRLHTRTPLMDELRKVKRVLEKAAGRVDEVLLVLDATTGQNGIAQAAAFAEAVDVSGVALAKMDGTAKGGIVLAVREELGVPVKLVGTGERIDDLQAFDPRSFATRILES